MVMIKFPELNECLIGGLQTPAPLPPYPEGGLSVVPDLRAQAEELGFGGLAAAIRQSCQSRACMNARCCNQATPYERV